MSRYLDEKGLSYFWGKVAGHSLPVREVTQEQYDALSEEEKQANVVYVVTGGEAPEVPEAPDVFPPGGIIMWSGLEADIPKGWALCDGANGTPDLRGRFVLGAVGGSNTYAVLVSGNKGINSSTSSITLTAKQALVDVAVDYFMEAEGADHFYVKKNASTVTGGNVSGIKSGTISVGALSANNTISLEYVKDGSVHIGADEVRARVTFRETSGGAVQSVTSQNIGGLFSISYPHSYKFSYSDSLLSSVNAFFQPAMSFGGESRHILTSTEMPSHSHIEYGTVVSSNVGSRYSLTYPTSSTAGTSSVQRHQLSNATSVTNALPYSSLTTGSAGSGYAHNNIPPYFALCYIMKL